MIRVHLTKDQRLELEKYRGQSSSQNSEKAFIVLLNSDGNSANAIAKQLHRSSHTVRLWLKRYLKKGLAGLERNSSSGRPRDKRKECMQISKDILAKNPNEFNYPDQTWGIPLIRYHLKSVHQIDVSEDTLLRGLKDLGYSYKRPSKTVSPKAPAPAEKKKAVSVIIESIQELMKNKSCEIFACDESHFSTEPYLVKGWFKKRWPPSDSKFQQKRRLHHVWVFKLKNKAFLLEEIR